MKVNLFTLKQPDIKVTVDAYFENGEFVIDGYDIGSQVKELLGDSDYEYIVKVPKYEVPKLYRLLKVEDRNERLLLLEIQKMFSGNEAYSKFMDWLEKNDVEGNGFTWV